MNLSIRSHQRLTLAMVEHYLIEEWRAQERGSSSKLCRIPVASGNIIKLFIHHLQIQFYIRRLKYSTVYRYHTHTHTHTHTRMYIYIYL